MRFAPLAAWFVLSAILPACAADDMDPEQHEELPVTLERTFDNIPIAMGEEFSDLCLSWRLDNSDWLNVQSVAMDAGPGWHHSNWFYVPEGTFPVDDGPWECAEEFDTLEAALRGGVLFAQSTQATSEVQAFRPGAAVEIPPRSVIVGQMHALNAGDRDVNSYYQLTVESIPEHLVDTPLRPLAFDFHALAIPPQQKSRFEVECDMAKTWGGELDIDIHYVLPHYHELGTGMDISMYGGTRDGEPIYDVDSRVGEPLGQSMSPPIALDGAQGVRFGCDFDNGTERTYYFGNGDGEMCIMLAFTDSPATWGGGVFEGPAQFVGMDGDTAVYTGDCQLIAILR